MATVPLKDINEHYRLLDLQGVKNFKLPIIFVLGGPGAGKASLCYRFRAHYGISYLSMGSLLRQVADEPTARGREMAQYVHQVPCRHVPVDLVMLVLKENLVKVVAARRPVFIQGFPRNFEQAARYEDEIAPIRHVLYLSTSDDMSKKRLLVRNRLATRHEDSTAQIARRRDVFRKEVEPIIENLGRAGRVAKLDGNADMIAVYKQARKVFCQWAHNWKKQFQTVPTEQKSRLKTANFEKRTLTKPEADIEASFPSVHYHGPIYDGHY